MNLRGGHNSVYNTSQNAYVFKGEKKNKTGRLGLMRNSCMRKGSSSSPNCRGMVSRLPEVQIVPCVSSGADKESRFVSSPGLRRDKDRMPAGLLRTVQRPTTGGLFPGTAACRLGARLSSSQLLPHHGGRELAEILVQMPWEETPATQA